MEHGYVISDLHMFTHRSTNGRYVEPIRQAAARADFLVLNGDTFDFRWSTLPTQEDTVAAAADWLEGLLAAGNRCRVFFVMGNHDALRPLAARLDELAERQDRFLWFPSHVRVDDALFLHGDLVFRPAPGEDPFGRHLAEAEKRMGPVLHSAYRVLVGLRAHRVADWFRSPTHCARRICRALTRHDRGLTDGLKHVYFGHTHAAFSDFEYEGLCFHNTGAAIRGVDCRLLKART